MDEVKALVPDGETLIVHSHKMLKVTYHNTQGVKFINELEDIQPLNLICSSLITDYSSLKYEFNALGKETISYQPDLEMYDAIHGLYK